MKIPVCKRDRMDRVAARVSVVVLLLGALALAGCAASDAPRFLGGPDPVYPAAARARGDSGFVVVAYTVEPDGTVANLRVVGSEPAGVFDAAALEAVARWRFQAREAASRELRSRLEFRTDDGRYRDIPAPRPQR